MIVTVCIILYLLYFIFVARFSYSYLINVYKESPDDAIIFSVLFSFASPFVIPVFLITIVLNFLITYKNVK